MAHALGVASARDRARIDLVVGCNGAGKSTFVQLVLGPVLPRSVFVNADLIAAQRWPTDPESHSYDAAKLAAQARSELIAGRRSLIAETVFSHESKLDIITDAKVHGFDVVVHAVMVPVDLAVARVGARVAAGGHSVPEDKIRQRYARLWPLVAAALKASDTGYIWDNASVDGPTMTAQLIDGYLVGPALWPIWTPPAITALQGDS